MDDPAYLRGRDAARAPMVVSVPGWLEDVLAGVAGVDRLSVTPVELNLHLEAPRAVLRVRRADHDAPAAWVGEALAVAYWAEAQSSTLLPLCERVGRRLEGALGRVEALFERALRPPDAKADAPGADAMELVAAGELAAVLAMDPTRIDTAPLARCLHLTLDGRPRDAWRALDAFVRAHEDEPMVVRTASRLARILGATELAVGWAERALTGRHGRARARGELELVRRLDEDDPDAHADRIDALLESAASAVADDARGLRALARAAHATRRYELAAAAWKRSLRLERDGEAFASLAELLLWRGDVSRAVACLDRAGLEPDDRAGLTGRGAAALLSGDIAGALRLLESAVAEQENPPPPALVWLGEARWRSGDPAGALEVLEAATRSEHTFAGIVLKARVLAEVAGGAPSWLIEAPDARSAGLFEGRLEGILPPEQLEAASSHTRTAVKALEDVLEVLGGNRTRTPTRVVDGRLEPLVVPKSPRIQASHALTRLPEQGVEATRAALRDVVDRWPAHPEPCCYLGELHLWCGEYDAALECFAEAHGRAVTRWSFIGEGAVHVMRGDLEAALERFEACERAVAPLEGATLVVYRGETHRLAGELDLARADLEAAVQAKRSRIGAWLNLALVRSQKGEEDAAGRAVLEVWRRAPAILRQASADVTGRPWEAPASGRDTAPVIERALVLMRGNRSSRVWTFAAPGEPLSVLTDPGRLRGWANANAALVQALRSRG